MTLKMFINVPTKMKKSCVRNKIALQALFGPLNFFKLVVLPRMNVPNYYKHQYIMKLQG